MEECLGGNVLLAPWCLSVQMMLDSKEFVIEARELLATELGHEFG